jgi:hypothetical protein
MRPFLLLALVVSLAWLAGGCATSSTSGSRQARPAEPVILSPRTIRPPSAAPAGTRVLLEVEGMPAVLFLPEGWTHPANAGRLAIHFHTPDWLAVGEHLRAGYSFPVVSIYLGEGSARYRAPFQAPARFRRLIAVVENEMRRRGMPGAAIRDVDVASFSAGYGAVRELVQQRSALGMIRRLVLSDSIYGSLASGLDGRGPRRVSAEHVECWLPLARAAMAGRKTFVLTLSEVATQGYASSGECAVAIVQALGLTWQPVAPGSYAAAREKEHPLLARADSGNLHFWRYAGKDEKAHMAHPRRLAEVWLALDAAR